jgi:mono/diheme cytochrome c family protein
MIRHLLFVTTTVLAFVVGATSIAGQDAKTTNSGVYTAAQSERGKKTFEAKCTACHDTARFTGEIFFESWNNKTMKDIWDVASGTMPEDNPGSLKPNEYADILSYFLQLNAFPTGDAELMPGAATMATIKIEKKP